MTMTELKQPTAICWAEAIQEIDAANLMTIKYHLTNIFSHLELTVTKAFYIINESK